jgi:phage/plasmid-like protein (TIGR03299 family)
MSHEIEQHGDLAAFVSSRDNAWHVLGTHVEGDLGVDEGFKLAKLTGWDVGLDKVYVRIGTAFKPTDRVATTRNNPFTGEREVLAATGISERYQTIQNEEVAAFVQNVLDSHEVRLSAAGSLYGGKKVFATMLPPEDVIIPGTDDAIKPFLVAAWSHDGYMSLTTFLSPVRVVCANTLSMALGSGTSARHRVRHAGEGVQRRVTEAREVLDVTFKSIDAFTETAARWAAREVTNAEFDKLVDGLFPKADANASTLAINHADRNRENYRWLYEEAPTQENIRGTAWAALNAYTELNEWFVGNYADAKARATAQAWSDVPETRRVLGAKRIGAELALPRIGR